MGKKSKTKTAQKQARKPSPKTGAHTATNEATMETEDIQEFHVGDRVVLQGLVKMKRLNGRHGRIREELDESTGRMKVDLDLLDQLPMVTAKPINLKHEAVPPTNAYERAGVSDGHLVEKHGRAFDLIIDFVRYLVGAGLHNDPTIRLFPDIQVLKDVNFEKCQFLTATGWSYWEDPGSYRGTQGMGIYQCLVESLPEMFGVENGNMDHLSDMEKLPLVALTDPVAVGGWQHRIHGSFWIVAKDPVDGGTLIVADENRYAVYKCFGMTTNLYDLCCMRNGGYPVKAKLTMLPWYGRFVYDGAVTTGARFVVPSKELTESLNKAVRSAQEEGRVLERLVQLELTDAAAPSTPSVAGDMPETQATREERLIIASLVPITPYAEADSAIGPGIWVFRRMGYSEEDNPNHEGVILANGDTVGRFRCSALEPESTDILKWLVQYSLERGRRPTNINIDDLACYKRVKFLLKDVEDIAVEYYPPPTKEERAAMEVMERAGIDPFS